MKKIICLLLLFFCSLFFCNIVFAKTNDDKTTIDIQGSLLKFEKQKNGTYDLVEYDSEGYWKDSTSNYKIKKRNVDGTSIYIAENEYNLFFYSPDKFVSEILPKYYNAFDNIKFINYPNVGTIKYSVQAGKSEPFYTLVSVNPNYVIIKKIDKERPRLYNDNFDDSNSIISKLLNISYIKIPNCDYYYNIENIPAFIDEEVKIENNKIFITYKNFSFQKHHELHNYPKIHKKIAYDRTKRETIFTPIGLVKFKNIQELYNKIEKETPYKFINYPQNFILAESKSDGSGTVNLIFYENGKKTKVLYTEYKDFYFSDINMFINQISDFNYNGISYQNPNRIIAKNKNGKWGMIDKDNNVKVPFIYDKILSIGNNVNEKIVNIDDEQAEQLIVKYMGQSKEYNMFFAFKDNKIGVINDKNDILVDFEPIKVLTNIDVNMINKSILANVKKAKLALKTGNIIKIITLPLWLPFFVLAINAQI